MPVHGTVQTAAGEKFDASICFQPLDGKRPVANGMVKNGEYRLDRSNGPTAGPAKVIVRRIVRRADSAASRTKPKPGPATKASSPGKLEWTETRDVKDDGSYTQDFTLKD